LLLGGKKIKNLYLQETKELLYAKMHIICCLPASDGSLAYRPEHGLWAGILSPSIREKRETPQILSLMFLLYS